MEYSQNVPLTGRLANAVVSYLAYLYQLIWPSNLAVFYPHAAGHTSIYLILGGSLLLIATSAVVLSQRDRRKFLVAGWFWFLVVMLPTIGVIQVGLQGRADRYTYLPHIGVCIGVVWLIGDIQISASATLATDRRNVRPPNGIHSRLACLRPNRDLAGHGDALEACGLSQ